MSVSRKTLADVFEALAEEVRCDNCKSWERVIADKGDCKLLKNPVMFSKDDFCSFWVRKESDKE